LGGGPSAEGAEGVGRRYPPPDWGTGLGRGRAPSPGMAPSPRNFLIFYLKMVSFGAFWVALPHCMLFRATAQESEAEEEGRERALMKDDILHS